ncbi:MAG TPA: hypothetical protein VFJ20_09900, partial [Gemmatimonadaceae bacterium]|nr:hypothetical protein [Gemmatimonadaceae bacterium]
MDKRTLLAFALMAIVIVVTPLLFPSTRRAPARRADSAATAVPQPRAPQSGVPAERPETAPAQSAAPAPQATVAAGAFDTVALANAHARYLFLNPGATPVSATAFGFRDLRPGRRDTVASVA